MLNLLSPGPTTTLRTVFRCLLGSAMVFAGVGHLSFARTDFQAQVPRWVPMDPDLVVLLSGVVEIVLGAALIFLPRYRVALGWFLALFYVAVFPGNIAQYLNGRDAFGLDTDAARLGRLFMQPLLIGWALWSTGAWRDRRSLV